LNNFTFGFDEGNIFRGGKRKDHFVPGYQRAVMRSGQVFSLTIDTGRIVILFRTNGSRVMYVPSAENASGFPFTVLTYMANSVTSKANFNFGYEWKDFITVATKEDVFREGLSSKFQTDCARRYVFSFAIDSYSPV